MEVGCQMQLQLALTMFLQMTNPDYIAIAELLKTETDVTVRQTLLDQLFVFNEELTEAEKNLFNYIEDTYIENNPGDVNRRLF
jgi:hypothetical protein